MSVNSFGRIFVVTTWGESHGPALGATVDGCPPGISLSESMIQPWLDRRAPGRSKLTTQRQEADQVRILSGVFEGKTTGTPIQLMIENTDQRSRDYGDIAERFRPGHADFTYQAKYGVRDYRGGGRSSARETAMRVAAGAIAKKFLAAKFGIVIRGCLTQMGDIPLAIKAWDQVEQNPFFCPDPDKQEALDELMRALKKEGPRTHNSTTPQPALATSRSPPPSLRGTLSSMNTSDLRPIPAVSACRPTFSRRI